jgi:hypothetical protein
MARTDTKDLVVSLKDFTALLPGLLALGKKSGKAVVFKSFPCCLSMGEPGVFDGFFPVTVLPDMFWREFSECGFGVHHTVWGIKNLGGEISWEFYFYDYRRRERERSITRLLDMIRPFTHCGIEANENLHYFMFSIDITNDLVSGGADLDEIHLYIGNPGSTVSSGICYSLKETGARLENFYFFFDAKKQIDEIVSKAPALMKTDPFMLIKKEPGSAQK